jgi:glycosyltransferase involved in cell wall biosynthesis
MTVRAFADAIATLLKDAPAGRAEIAAAARAAFEADLSWPRHAPGYVSAVSPGRSATRIRSAGRD